MKPETEEWIEKAEGNWSFVQWSMQADEPVWDVICFLCQQCGEKYLKAFLEEQGINFPKTHDLVLLLNLSAGLLPELLTHKQELAYLTALSVATRYPGMAVS
ncbi:MAG TPA: HEPN domain-containing protein [Chloroflexia bacterium]|jgi:HEPN domain-containing protein